LTVEIYKLAHLTHLLLLHYLVSSKSDFQQDLTAISIKQLIFPKFQTLALMSSC